MKRLRKGQAAVLVDASGHPRDATGHRTDLPAVYSKTGKRLWRAEELAYGLGERVRATRAHHRMSLGECGTIMTIPEFVHPEYYVLPDSLLRRFLSRRSGEFLSRMPQHYLEPE